MNRNLLASFLAVGERHIPQQFWLLNACYPSLFTLLLVCWLLPNQLSAQCDALMVSSAATICQGETTQLRATGGINYNWSPALGLSCTTCPDPVASPTSSTTYTVSCDDNGVIVERQVTITVMPMPNIIDITTSLASGCDLNDGDIVIQANGGTGDLEYSIDNGFSFEESANFFNLSGGTYQIKVRNSDRSCVVDGGEVNLGNVNSPSGTVTTTIQPNDCGTFTGAIGITGMGGTGALEYSFDNGQNWQSSNTFTNIPAGFYRTRIRNSDETCETNIGTVILGDPVRPFIGQVVASAPTCGNSDGSIMVSATGEAVLEYSINGTDWQTDSEFTGLAGGSYMVMVRNQSSIGCVTPWDNNPVTLDAGTPPTISSTTFTSPTDCAVNDGTVTVAASGEATIEYSLDGGATYQSENTFIGLAAGTYTAIVRNANGTCAVNGDAVTLSAPVAPTLNAPVSTNPADCATSNGTITLTAADGEGVGNYEFSIDGGMNWQNTGNFSGLMSGQYFPAVRNVSMTCQVDGATLHLVAPGGITIDDIMLTTPSDCGASDGAIAINLSGGTEDFRYRLNDGNFENTPNFTGLPNGDYAITVRNSDGTCETNGNIIQLQGVADIVINDISSVSPTNCEIPNGSITFDATGSEQMEYSINGTNFQLSNVFSAMPEGDYTPMVRYSAGQKCAQTGAVVTLDPAPRAVISGISSSDITDCNGTTSLTFVLSAESTGTYSYSIDGGQTWQSFSSFGGVTEGTYNFRVRNQDGSCLVDGGSRTFNEPTPPVVNNISTRDPSDCGLSDGRIVVTATAAPGEPTLEYTRNGGIDWQSSNQFLNLDGGDYIVMVRYLGGTCPIEAGIITLATPTAPTISEVQTSSPSICGAGDGTITITATGGSGTYSYSNDGGATFQDSNVFAAVDGGDYTIAVRNQDRTCVVISNITTTVTDNNPPVINSITTNDPTGCGLNDGQIIIDATGSDGLTLEYSNDGGVSYQASNTFNNLPESTYNIFVRYTNGGCATNAGNFIVDNPDAPEILNIDARNPECDADNGMIMINARHDGSATLEYSNDGGATYQASSIFENLSVGSYPLRVRVAGTSCVTSAGTNILEENAPPVINFVNVIQSDNCANVNGLIEIFTSGGNPEFYEYSINGGQNWQSNRKFENLAAGIYDVAVRIENTICVVDHDETVTLSQPSEPAIGTVETVAPSCGAANGSITITGTGGNPPYQYTINGGADWQPIATYNNLPEGNYLIGVRNSDGNCAVFGQNFRLSEPDDPDVTMINSDNPTCDENDGMIEIIAAGARDIEYSIDGGDTYVSTNEFTGLDVNTYEVFVRYTDGTCSVNAGTVQLVDPDRPTMTGVNTNNPSDCGAANGTIQITANGSSALEYSIDDGLTYQSSNNFQDLVAGTYPIRVRFTDGSCEIFGGNMSLSDPASPTITMIDSADPSECSITDGAITISATSGGDADIEYSINGGETFQPSNEFSGLGGGTYVIQARNDDGSCVVAGNTITLTDKVEPEITSVITKNPDCDMLDGEIVIAATGAGVIEYSIDGGTTYQGNGTFAALGEGIYNIRVRNLDGSCVISDPSVTLSEPAAASVTSFDATNPSCEGDDGSIEIFIAGGDGNVQYSIDNGTTYQDESIFENLSAQEYNIFIRNSDGRCSQFGGTTELIAPDVPVINGVTVSQITDCTTNDASIVVNTNEANVEFSRNGGQTYQSSNTFSGLGAGNYDIRARRVGQTCDVMVETVTIAAADQPMATVTSSDPTSCDTDNGSISISANAANQEYSLDNTTFQSGLTFANLGGGTYTVYARFTDNTSCSVAVAENVVLTAPTQPVINTVTSQDADCQGNGGTITIDATGDNLEYSIDNGVTFQGTNGFVNVATGNYQVVVRNVGGTCPVNGDAITIAQEGMLTIDDVVVNGGDCNNEGNASITITATGDNLEYSIDGGTTFQSNNTFNNLAVGTYQIRIRNSNESCMGTADDVVISSGTPPTIASIDTTNPDCGQTGGRIAININGNGSYQYSINDGVTYQDANIFNGVSPGTYQIWVRNANESCEVSADNTVTISPASQPVFGDIEQTNPSNCGANDGTIAVSASGNGDIEYSLDATNFQSGNLFSGLAPGTYQVTIRNADGTCPVTANNAVILLGAEAPVITGVDPNNPSGCDVANGSIEITASGSNLEYSIDGGSSYQGSRLFENLNSGTYQISVRRTDDLTCTATTDDVVLGDAATPVINSVIAIDAGNCGEATGRIIVNVENAGEVEYSIDDGVSYQTNNRFENLASGAYNLRIRTIDGSCEITHASNPVVINGTDNIIVSDVEVTNPSDCGTTDGAMTIAVSGANEPLEYSIDGGANYQDIATFINLPGGIYNVLVRTVNSGCVASSNGPVELVAPSAPMIADVDFTNPTGCEESNGTISITASGNDLMYSIDNGVSFQSENVFEGLENGMYQIVVQNSDGSCTTPVDEIITLEGCCDIQYTIEQLANGRYLVSLISDTTFTGNDNGTFAARITIVAPVGGFEIENFENSTPSVAFQVNSILAPAENPNSNYYVFNLGTATTAINYQEGVSIPLFTFDNASGCAMDGAELTLYDAVNDTYQGSDVGQSIDIMGFGDEEITICVTGSTGVAPIPSVLEAINVTQPTTCMGNGSISIVTTNGIPVEYSLNGGAEYQASGEFTDLLPGSYLVAIRRLDADCEIFYSDNPVMIDGNMPAIINSVNATDPTVCGLADGTITILADGTSTVEYSIDGGTVYQASNQFTNLAAGTYNIMVRNVNGSCPVTYDQNPVILTEPNAEVVITDVMTEQADCSDQSGALIIDAEGCDALEYSIDGINFQPNNAFLDLMSGAYTVTVRSTVDNSMTATQNVTLGRDMMCTDTIRITLPPTGGEVCIDEVLNVPNGAGANTLCEQAENTPLTVMDNATCFAINPVADFVGTDEICLVTCDVTDNNICDTTYIIVTVDPNVVDIQTDTIRIILPSEGGEVCIDDVLDVPNGAGMNTLCEQGENTPIMIADNATCFAISPVADFVGTDEICLVTCDVTDTNICDTTYVIVTVDPSVVNTQTDTVRVTIPPTGGEVCINDVLDLPNGVGINSLCEQAENTPLMVMENVSCFAINPVAEFIGMDTVCIVTCDINALTVCDTTYVVVTVEPMMTDIQTDTIRMDIMPEESLEVCINNVLDLPNNAGSSTLCNDDHVVAPSIVNTDGNVCVNVTAPTDFMGSDTICIVTCDAIETDLCDTTIVIINPEMVMEIPLPDTIRLQTPLETGIDLCYDQYILPADDVNVTLCGDATNGSVSISEDEPCISYFPDLGFLGSDEYCVSFCDANDPTNCDTLYVLIDVTPQTDVLTIEVDNTEPFDTCLTEYLDLLGDYASSAICDMNADEVMVTLDQDCVTIDPVEGFEGTTEICVVVCDDNEPQICDTTQIVVTVVSPDCTEDIFSMDMITLPNMDGSGELCVPIPFNESSTYDVSIDGIDYTQAVGRCDVDSTVVYFYGNIASATTLEVSSWTVNGMTFSGTITTGITGLMEFLNDNDPSETWIVDMITNTISTTNAANNMYGNLVLTPDTTGEEITLNPGAFGTANGFSISIAGAGQHEVIITNTATGCIDQVMVIVEEEPIEPCNILPDSPINLTTDDCMERFTVCLNDTLANFNDYTLDINGELFGGDFLTCMSDTMFQYLYTTVPDLANVGPYTIDSWLVNGEVLSGTFNNIAGLVAFMNGVDAGGNWTADFQTFSIIGGNNGNTYGDLVITQDVSGASATLSPTNITAPQGVAIELGVGTYFLELSNAEGCLDELAINITCPDSPIFMDTDIVVDIPVGDTETICIRDVIGINNGDIASATNTCPDQSGTNATVSINEDTYCLEITGITPGSEFACIEVCNTSGECVVISVTINVTENTDCMDIISQEVVGMGINCTDNPLAGDLCLDIPLMMFADLDVEVNGAAYTGTLRGCKVDSSFTYSYFTLISLGDGPYRVESWMVNGVTFSGAFLSVGDLVDSMNVWDETAMWMQDEATLNIVGGNPTTAYGSLQISDTVTGASATIELNRSLVPVGTVLTLPLGTSEVVFIHQDTGCRDTISATIACMTTDTIPVTVMTGQVDTVCIDTLELMGNFVNIENACPEESGEFSLVTIDEETLCVAFEGIEAGEEQACIIVCDDLGICDTTYFDITITDENTGLEAVDDIDTTGQGGVVVINVLNNDRIPSNSLDTFYIDTAPLNGTAIFNEDGTVTYQHDGNDCDITDAFTYVICTATQCDTAVVEVYIDCDEDGGFEIFNGFSPNGDGINDFFTIQGIEQFPNNTLRIYNRWGNIVFEQQDYKNKWAGTWDDKDVPDGTYFYVFDTGTGEIMSGWLQISR